MKSLAAFESSFPIYGSCVNITGDISMVSRASIPGWKDHILYDDPVLNFTDILSYRHNALSWDQIMKDYASRDGIYPDSLIYA
jgi:hypothetical protein